MSGYESNRFVGLPQSIERNLICSVCLNIYNNAIRTHCGHTFCKSCLQNWIQSNESKNCPDCREQFTRRRTTSMTRVPLNSVILSNFVFKYDLTANNIINDLIIKCDYESNGCKEEIKLGLLSTHLLECEHRLCKTCGFTVGLDVEHNCLELMKTDRNQLKAKLNEITDKNSLLEEEIKSYKVLNQKFNEMITKNRELEKKLNNKSNELKHKLENIKIKESKQKINEMITKYKKLEEEIKNKDLNWNQRLNELKDQNKKLTKELDNKTTELKLKGNELKDKNKKLEKEMNYKRERNQLKTKLNEITAKNLKLNSVNKSNEEMVFRLNNQFRDIPLKPLNVYFGTQYTNSYEIHLSYYGFDFKSFFIKFESLEELRFCSNDSNPNLIVIKLRTNSQMCTTIQNSIHLSEASRGWFDVRSNDPNERYLIINISNPTLEFKLFLRVSLVFYLFRHKPDLICKYESLDVNQTINN